MLLGIAAVTEESVKHWIETVRAVILSPGQGTHLPFQIEGQYISC